MDKKEVINRLNKEYGDFTDYINGLSESDYKYRFEEKWSAKQQLEHIEMCVKPLVQVYGMPKPLIEQNFGKVDRPNKSYQELLDDYLKKLSEGGKAPNQYVPDDENITHKGQLVESLKSLIEKLNYRISEFEEAELESLMIPHPLLGKITLKEMLYNAIYHVQHHKNQAIENLENR